VLDLHRRSSYCVWWPSVFALDAFDLILTAAANLEFPEWLKPSNYDSWFHIWQEEVTKLACTVKCRNFQGNSRLTSYFLPLCPTYFAVDCKRPQSKWLTNELVWTSYRFKRPTGQHPELAKSGLKFPRATWSWFYQDFT
jgi:hypothetical protein